MKKLTKLLLIILPLILAACSGVSEISSYKADKIVLDGNDKDWEGKTTYLKDDNMLFGVQNDKENLYIMISTLDRQRQFQIIRTGMIFWFDPEGGSSHKYGLRFPSENDEPMARMLREQREQGADALNEMLKKITAEVDIYDAGSDQWLKESLPDTKGLDIKMTRQGERLICEIRVALTKGGNMFYIPVKENSLGVGLETAQREMKMMRNRMGEPGEGGMPPAGDQMPQSGGRRGGGGRRGTEGAGGQQRAAMPQQVKEWFKVTLAS